MIMFKLLNDLVELLDLLKLFLFLVQQLLELDFPKSLLLVVILDLFFHG